MWTRETKASSISPGLLVLSCCASQHSRGRSRRRTYEKYPFKIVQFAEEDRDQCITLDVMDISFLEEDVRFV